MRNAKCEMRNAKNETRNAKCEMRNVNGKLAPGCYERPELEILELDVKDIITTSPGTETTPKDDPDGIWDLDIS